MCTCKHETRATKGDTTQNYAKRKHTTQRFKKGKTTAHHRAQRKCEACIDASTKEMSVAPWM